MKEFLQKIKLIDHLTTELEFRKVIFLVILRAVLVKALAIFPALLMCFLPAKMNIKGMSDMIVLK